MASDGSLDIHARYTVESDAGALIQIDSKGMRHGPPDVLARMAKGEDVDPSLYYFRTVMRFETAHPKRRLDEPHPRARAWRAREECREARCL